MQIIVLVKEVPDTYGDRKLDAETGLADRNESQSVLDEIGERAIEVALKYADGRGGVEVVLLSMSPGTAAANLRKGLAMGAHRAVHVVDERLAGADLHLTAQVLATAAKRIGYDLILAGNQSTDGGAGLVPAMLGELLDVPSAVSLSSVEIQESRVSGERELPDGTQEIIAAIPAVVSITEKLPEGRYPNFKGIMAAKKKPFEALTLDDLGVVPEDPERRYSIVTSVKQRPPREAGLKVTDDGTGVAQLVEFLAKQRLV